MRRSLLALAAFSSVLFAQGTPETRVYPLANIATPQSMQETVNAIRSLAEIREVSGDWANRRLVVTGDAEQLAFADWIVRAADEAPSARPTTFTVRDTTFRDPRSATSVKLVYPAHLASPQHLQEAINAVRSIAEVQRVVAFTNQKALLMRGLEQETALAEWILQDFDNSAGGAASHETRQATYQDNQGIPERYRSTAVRIYHPTRITAPRQLQEAINGIRSIAEVQRIVAFTGGAIALRGPEVNVSVADWLEKELDQPASAASAREFAMPGESIGIVHTFYLPKTAAPEDLMNSLNIIRQHTGIQRAVVYSASSAIILRGTADQIEKASGLLH